MRAQLERLWEQLNTPQRAALVAVGVLTVVAVVGVAIWATRPAYGILYAGLDPSEASEIINQLSQEDIPYRLTNGGTAIAVPQKQISAARLKLASSGLPSITGQAGFELFDKSGLPGTDFSNTIAYQRAIQGELCRTIEALREVRSARVHIVIPRDRLFSREKQSAKASVIIDTGGAELGDDKVRSIKHLVASAVDGLTLRGVTVVDTMGTVLSAGVGSAEEAVGGSAVEQATACRQIEEQLRRRVQGILDEVIGANKAVVAMHVELSFDQEESVSERSEPTAGPGIPVREHAADESYAGAETGPLGPPGVTANITPAVPMTAGGGGTFTSTEKTTEYHISKITEQRVKAPGAVQRISVAAVVDASLSPTEIAAVRNVITAAAGIDLTRGDQIVVESMTLAGPETMRAAVEEDTTAVAAERRARLRALGIEYGVLLLAAGLVIAFVARAALRARAADEASAPAEPQQERAEMPIEMEPVSEPLAQAAVKRPAEGDALAEAFVAQSAEGNGKGLKDLVRTDPDAAAGTLRSWISGGG